MEPMKKRTSPVRIGCYSAFWGDSVAAAAQLIRTPHTVAPLDYVVADYLAEVTMGILAKRMARNAPGYVDEFVRFVIQPLLPTIVKNKIRIVTNAGGLDPVGLKIAIEEAAEAAGLADKVVVAAVTGDNLMGVKGAPPANLLPFSPTNDGMFADAIPAHDELVSINAYTGAFPVARALDAGATIVVTGRVVDSALVVGPLISEYGWAAHDYDQLAAGSLVGHLLECGCQATGGNFTDWQLSAPGWSNMGYPIAEVDARGDATITKLPGTGGVVSRLSVGEQMVYEVLDPRKYLLPDVTLDLADVVLTETAPDRVRVTGARGFPPTDTLKVSAITAGDFTMTAELLIAGHDARRKAEAVGNAIVARTNRLLLTTLGVREPITRVRIECLGSEELYGPHRRDRLAGAREVVLRLTAAHPDRRALGLLAMELAPSATCMAPGITGAGSGRPRPSRQLRHISALVPRSAVRPEYHVASRSPCAVPFAEPRSAAVVTDVVHLELHTAPADAAAAGDTIHVPLICLAVGRSGDKGDVSNIGILARDPAFYPLLCEYLTADRVHAHMKHLVAGRVDRFTLPGSHALNFVLTQALGGGGLASLHIDRQGKTYAQVLLSSITVPVPRELVGRLAYPELFADKAKL
ncbi:hypothetical protein H9P43_002264 [Blastocladiella emersonii ATCC 22665]|nr:hypothetical protein H9P43_002264 [Blastocladiella emersonii ATCC 22665]